MHLPAITWQSIFYRCINQLLIMQFDDAGFILSATAAHLHCVLIKFCEACWRVGNGDVIVGGVFLQYLWRLLC